MEGGLDFGEALHLLKGGSKVARAGWNAHHHLELQVPDEHSKMTRPYIFMTVGEEDKLMPGSRLPWVASQTDLLATDWFEVTE